MLADGGLVVHHYNRRGMARDYDFSTLPVAEPIQRSLAELFAARCVPHRWSTHVSSTQSWYALEAFAGFVGALERPVESLEEMTATHIKHWRLSYGFSAPGQYGQVASLLRDHGHFQVGRIADELARKVPRRTSQVQSYPQADFDRLKTAAQRDFRAALLRIRQNAAHLRRWRDGHVPESGSDFVVGEVLDLLAGGGDLPRKANGASGRTLKDRYREALGGTEPEQTWGRLFLTSQEAVALGVLLLAEFGWNLSVIDTAEVPLALPDQGEDGRPVYRIPVEKYRRGPRLHFETRNVADDGAASKGRLITEALEATRFARMLVEEMAPGTNRLVVWRVQCQSYDRPSAQYGLDRLGPVGPFRFGIVSKQALLWARRHGFDGSPFQRGRRTVLVVDKREPAQHTQDTHDRSYALVDKQVQASSVEIIAEGALEAADHARKAVLAAQLVEAPVPGDVPVAVADCQDMDTSPVPAPGGGCAASFLMCLGCENAHVHPGHHARLAYLHKTLAGLRSALAPGVWESDWDDTHARLEDLKTKVGPAIWSAALAQASTADQEMITLLLAGDLDP